MSTKIEWTNDVYNPVWGCKNNCPYCYARKFAKRMAGMMAKKEYPEHPQVQAAFAKRLHEFKPTWISSNYYKKFSKKPKRIFVDSMSDIAFWDWDWMEKTLRVIEGYPQHTFQFLTKRPQVYLQYEFSLNCWLGATITNNNELSTYQDNLFFMKNFVTFLSIEPILEKIDITLFNNEAFDWIIIGAETGNRKGKIKVQPIWIKEILLYCARNNIPVFMKNNLCDIWPDLIQEFPERK